MRILLTEQPSLTTRYRFGIRLNQQAPLSRVSLKSWIDDSIFSVKNFSIYPATVGARARSRTDLVERNRRIDAFAFFWSFAVGTTQSNGSLAAVQDLYKAFTDNSVAYSSVQQRATYDLTELLTDICGCISVELRRTESAPEGRFERFRDAFISDGTICTLSSESFDEFLGLSEALRDRITHLAGSDLLIDHQRSYPKTTQLRIGDWVEDSLVLFDLGYLDYAKLAWVNAMAAGS